MAIAMHGREACANSITTTTSTTTTTAATRQTRTSTPFHLYRLHQSTPCNAARRPPRENFTLLPASICARSLRSPFRDAVARIVLFFPPASDRILQRSLSSSILPTNETTTTEPPRRGRRRRRKRRRRRRRRDERRREFWRREREENKRGDIESARACIYIYTKVCTYNPYNIYI